MERARHYTKLRTTSSGTALVGGKAVQVATVIRVVHVVVVVVVVGTVKGDAV
jgi:hypothetical protein